MGRRTNYSTCKATGKRRFRTEEDAEAALRQSRKMQENRWHGGSRRERRYYDCDQCGGFHLTKLERFVPYDPWEDLRLETLKALESESSVVGEELTHPAARADAVGG